MMFAMFHLFPSLLLIHGCLDSCHAFYQWYYIPSCVAYCGYMVSVRDWITQIAIVYGLEILFALNWFLRLVCLAFSCIRGKVVRKRVLCVTL